MNKKAAIIALSIIAAVYIPICLLSGFIVTFILNDSLTFCQSVDKDTARKWGLSVYEDVTIEPNILNLPNGKMRLGNAFLVIGRYRKFTIPYVPGVVTANKYSFKINSEWQRIQLRFDVIESPTGEMFGRTYTGPGYKIDILEDPNMFCPLIYNDTACCINVTKDRCKQYHGCVVDSNGENKIDGTDYVITVSWDQALKDWGSEEKVWYPGYPNPHRVNK